MDDTVGAMTDEGSNPPALSVSKLRSPEMFGHAARVQSLEAGAVTIGTAVTTTDGSFVPDPTFITNSRLEAELCHVETNATPLVLSVWTTAEDGSHPTLLGSYQSPFGSMEPCKVGSHHAIRFYDHATTALLRDQFVKLAHLLPTHVAATPEDRETYGRQPVIFWWLAIFEDEGRRDNTYRQLFGDCLLGAVNRLAVAECYEDRRRIQTAMHLQDSTALQDFCIDPRPPRIDQTTGLPHLDHDPYWRQRYRSSHGLKRCREEE